MSNAAFVLIAVAVIIVVSVLLWFLNRKPQTFMSSIDDFEREMKALGGETNKATKSAATGRQRRRAISPSARRTGPDPGPGVTLGPDPGSTSPTQAGPGAGGGVDGADTSGEPQP
jgi:hypothetical protein